MTALLTVCAVASILGAAAFACWTVESLAADHRKERILSWRSWFECLALLALFGAILLTGLHSLAASWL